MSNVNNQRHEVIFFTDPHVTLDSIDIFYSKLKEKLFYLTSNIVLINGDFIDENVEFYSKDTLQLFIDKLHNLLQLLQQHCETIILIHGNHDELMLKRYEAMITKNLQIKILSSYLVESEHTKYIFMHGHQFDTRNMYHQLQKIIPFRRIVKKYTKTSMRRILPSRNFDQQSIIRRKNFLHNIVSSHKIRRANDKDSLNLVLGHFHNYQTFNTSILNKNLKNSITLNIVAIPALNIENELSINVIDQEYSLFTI